MIYQVIEKMQGKLLIYIIYIYTLHSRQAKTFQCYIVQSKRDWAMGISGCYFCHYNTCEKLASYANFSFYAVWLEYLFVFLVYSMPSANS